ncbi:MAG: hypothetical protein ABFR36_06540 [Acidobacteriota bacterium]
MKIEIPEKLAILSDIHGNISALEAVVDDLKKKQVEEVINQCCL